MITDRNGLSDLPGWLRSPKLVEELAAVEHDRWAHWQRYLHDQCFSAEDGSLVIPAELVQRWTRQLHTPYAELPQAEKDSDREQVVAYLGVIAAHLRQDAPEG